MLRRSDKGVNILSNIVLGQDALHAAFGGVVPEIAARAHAEKLDHAVEEALAAANVPLSGLDGIAVTAGPGLIGGVLAGVMCAKGLATALGLPIYAVNHLAAHALTPRLTDDLPYPYLLLLVSGGHCQFLLVESDSGFIRLGGTIDDAPGEAFDKAARLLGLGQPGGPAIERAARRGDPAAVPLPRPLLDRPGMELSFSGLKTALLRASDHVRGSDGSVPEDARADLAASFQAAICDVLVEKSRRAMAAAREETGTLPAFAVAGGVAANGPLRDRLTRLCAETGVIFVAPPLPLCTDNAAMVAHVGLLMADRGAASPLDFPARPRWPLDERAAPMLGSGKRGAKA